MDGHLFRSENLAVRARLNAGDGPCVITFDPYTDERTLDREAFGESFLRDLGIDAIHVLSRQNDWYQYPELVKAAEAVRVVVAGRERVVAYGSSMGGYAAIRFGRLFGAGIAAAFSPQFSIDPSVAPFDRRWIGEAERIDFALERNPAAFTPRSFIFYDPHDIDRRHVDLFRQHTEVVDAPVPLGGHPCTTILAETKLLQPLVIQLIQKGDVEDFQHKYRAARQEVAQFFVNLSLRSKRARARSRFAERAYRIKREPMYASHYGQMLAAEGRFQEGRALFDWAAAEEPNNLVIKYRFSEFLEATGEPAAALETMDGIFAMTSDVRAFWPRREHLSKWLSERWSSQFLERFSQKCEPVIEAPQEALGPERSFLRRLRPSWLRPSTAGPPPSDSSAPSDYGPQPGVAADVLLTTSPAPPQFTASWRRHLDLAKRATDGRYDFALIGDSLTEWWPERFWSDQRVFNFGMAGDRTQHLVWRLLQLPDGALRARAALLMIGTNNLGCGDSAEAITAGVSRVLEVLRRKSAIDRIIVVEVPPMGRDFDWRRTERLRAHEGLRGLGVETLNVDEELTAGDGEGSSCYAEDGVHFSDVGYAVLTAAVRRAFEAE